MAELSPKAAQVFRADACSSIIGLVSPARKAVEYSQPDNSLKPKSMSHRPVTLFAAIVTLLMLASVALAQQTAQSSTPASNVGISRSYWFEISLVVVMVGGALWAVCRSSNRQ